MVSSKLLKSKRHGFAAAMMQFRKIVNDPKVRNSFKIGSDIFTAFGPMIDEPSKWNLARGIFGVGKVIVDHYEMYVDDYFEGSDDWSAPYTLDFSPLIMDVFKSHPFITMSSGGRDTYVKIVDLGDNCNIGWTVWEKLQSHMSAVYLHCDNFEMTKEKIKAALWEQFKDKSLTMRRSTASGRRRHDDSLAVTFEPDILFSPLSSQRATQYSAYLKRCLDADVTRSVMLYGPPGTGKSTMACTIVNLLGLRSFRIRIGDLERMENCTLFDAINIFSPDAVILDDFDRAHNQDELLEVLEYFQQRVKLVIATVNNKNEIDQAILRPGRFDELVNIKCLDEDVVKSVLGHDNLDVLDAVKDWPIAFIHELVKRRRFMSTEDALKATSELRHRVEKLSEYNDEDEDDVCTLDNPETSDEARSVVAAIRKRRFRLFRRAKCSAWRGSRSAKIVEE
jgi:adenylate kinase family enzyme